MFTHVPVRDPICDHLRHAGLGRHHLGAFGEDAAGTKARPGRPRRPSPGDHRPGGQPQSHGGGQITVVAPGAAPVSAVAPVLMDRAQAAQRER